MKVICIYVILKFEYFIVFWFIVKIILWYFNEVKGIEYLSSLMIYCIFVF